MSKQAVVPRHLPKWDVISNNVNEREPDPEKGVRDCDAFVTVGSDDWISRMIDEMPSGDMPVGKYLDSYGKFSYLFLTAVMSTAATSIDPTMASTEQEFAWLANRWHDETDFLSPPSRVTGNETYLQIISLGKGVIPLILEDLKERGGNWYRALRILSGEDPVPVEIRGDVEQMKRAWLQWGHDRGYIK